MFHINSIFLTCSCVHAIVCYTGALPHLEGWWSEFSKFMSVGPPGLTNRANSGMTLIKIWIIRPPSGPLVVVDGFVKLVPHRCPCSQFWEYGVLLTSPIKIKKVNWRPSDCVQGWRVIFQKLRIIHLNHLWNRRIPIGECARRFYTTFHPLQTDFRNVSYSHNIRIWIWITAINHPKT